VARGILGSVFAACVAAAVSLEAQEAPRQRLEFIVKFKADVVRSPEFAQAQGPGRAWLEKHSIGTAGRLHPTRPVKPKRQAQRPVPDLQSTYVLRPKPEHAARHRELLAALRSDPQVEWVQLNGLVHTQLLPNDPYLVSSNSWSQGYDDLYGLKLARAPEAWDVTRGAGVVIAVVDTGVDFTHSDLQANIFTNPDEVAGNNIDDDGNGYIDDVRGWDFVGQNMGLPAEDNDPTDARDGHGTHVAGIIAATGNNGIGIAGMAWQARIMAVKGLDDTGYGDDAALARAIVYAANNGGDIINASWGGGGDSAVLEEAVRYAHGLGVIFVAAAGNANGNLNNFHPVNAPEAIAVAASDHRDARASFSNFGERLDVTAPGVDTLSLRAGGTTLGTPVDALYTRASGTSMAAPHVCGVAALLLAQNPSWTPEQIRQALRKSAFDVSLSGFDTNSGYGRIDAQAAVGLTDSLEARIRAPAFGTLVNAPIEIGGYAAGASFQEYTLEYAPVTDSSTWTIIIQTNRPVSPGVLGVFDPSTLADREYVVRLRVLSIPGQTYEDRTHLVVDRVNIADPAVPAGRAVARVLKPGVVLPVRGNAFGDGFQRFRLEWAKGLNAASGWSSTGVGLANNGASPVTNGMIGAWSSPATLAADFYTLRLTVQTASYTSEATTYIYFEPDLISTNWPQWVDQGPLIDVGMVPAKQSNGSVRLTLASYSWWLEPTLARVWSFSPDGANRRHVDLHRSGQKQHAVGNLNMQPGDEMIAPIGGGLLALNGDLSTNRVLRGNFGYFEYSSVLISDLDGDQSPEMVATASTGGNAVVLAWKTNGALLPSFPLEFVSRNFEVGLYCQNSLLAIDLDGDRRKEIVVLTGEFNEQLQVKVFDLSGRLRWATPPMNARPNQISAADLDHDGAPEIVLSCFNMPSSNTNLVFVYTRLGQVRPGWPVALPPLANSKKAYFGIADMDRDGAHEIVVSAGRVLHVLKADGTPLNAAWPMEDGSRRNGPVAIADLNNDRFPEIVLAQAKLVSQVEDYDIQLRAYRHDGSLFKAWQLFGISNMPPHIAFCPSIGDFDRNGKTDIAVCSPLTSPISRLEQGVISVLTLNETYNPLYADWPMNLRDPQNSAILVPPPLKIARAGPSIVLSWPADAGLFNLETAWQLSAPSWPRLTPAITVTNNSATAIIPRNLSSGFYRLR
jgi:subtilisin family serine protease